MADILYSAAQIGDAYAPSLNAAFAEIYQASGIEPRVLSPNGGERSVAQEKRLGGTAASDHVKKRAVDIDNQRQLRNWNEGEFLAILARHGWHNVTEAGKPFSKEPWHFANQSSTPAGGGFNPINTQEDDMPRFIKLDGGFDPSGRTFHLEKQFIHAHNDANERHIDAEVLQAAQPVVALGVKDFAAALSASGLAGIAYPAPADDAAHLRLMLAKLPNPAQTVVADNTGVLHTY